MAEMLNYQNDLTAMTQGRASFTMEFDHYDFVPQLQADKDHRRRQGRQGRRRGGRGVAPGPEGAALPPVFLFRYCFTRLALHR